VDEAYLIQFYYAPNLQTVVLQTTTRKGQGLRSKWELVSAPKK
jgi:hypothetical protein